MDDNQVVDGKAFQGNNSLSSKIKQAPGYRLFAFSWAFVRSHSQLLLFPLSAFVVTGALFALFFPPLADGFFSAEEVIPGTYPLFISFWFLLVFNFVFFKAACLSSIYFFMRDNQRLSFTKGITNAAKRIFPLAVWALACSVGLLILAQVLRRGSIAVQTTASVATEGFLLVTMFVSPSLIFEKLNLLKAFSRSTQLFRSRWMTTTATRYSVSSVFISVHLVAFVLMFFGSIALIILGANGLGVGLFILYIPVLIVLLLFQSVINSVILAGLYYYAVTGKVPEQYERELLIHSAGTPLSTSAVQTPIERQSLDDTKLVQMQEQPLVQKISIIGHISQPKKGQVLLLSVVIILAIVVGYQLYKMFRDSSVLQEIVAELTQKPDTISQRVQNASGILKPIELPLETPVTYSYVLESSSGDKAELDHAELRRFGMFYKNVQTGSYYYLSSYDVCVNNVDSRTEGTYILKEIPVSGAEFLVYDNYENVIPWEGPYDLRVFGTDGESIFYAEGGISPCIGEFELRSIEGDPQTFDPASVLNMLNTRLNGVSIHPNLENVEPQRLDSHDVWLPIPEDEISEFSTERYTTRSVSGIYIEKTNNFEPRNYDYEELLSIHRDYTLDLAAEGFELTGSIEGILNITSYFQRDINGKTQVIELVTKAIPAEDCFYDMQNTVIPSCDYSGEFISLFISDPFDIESSGTPESFDWRTYRSESYNSELQELYNEYVGSDSFSIEFLYEPRSMDAWYYVSSVSGSSACCGVVKYDPSTRMFSDTGIHYSIVSGESASPTGRYVVVLDKETSPAHLFKVIDLESESVVVIDGVSPKYGEALRSGQCGYDGYTYDINWDDTDTGTIIYGVYTAELINSCDASLIEYRTIELPN